MSVEVIASVLIKVIVLGGIGFCLRKVGVADDTFDDKLTTILLNIVIPCGMLSAANFEYSSVYVSNMLWATVAVVVFYAVGYPLCYLLTRTFKLEHGAKNTMVNLMMLGNVGFIGLPVIGQIYGAEGNLYTTVYFLIFNLVAFSVSLILAGGKFEIKTFVKNPVTIVSVISVALFFSPVRFPGVVLDVLDVIGSLSSPLSMFVLGSSLAKVKFSSLFTSGWAWVANLVNMLVFPLAMAGILWACGLRGMMPTVLLVLTSMPPAATNVIFARKYNNNLPMATRAVSQGLILMVAALPLYALLGLWLFGV